MCARRKVTLQKTAGLTRRVAKEREARKVKERAQNHDTKKKGACHTCNEVEKDHPNCSSVLHQQRFKSICFSDTQFGATRCSRSRLIFSVKKILTARRNLE